MISKCPDPDCSRSDGPCTFIKCAWPVRNKPAFGDGVDARPDESALKQNPDRGVLNERGSTHGDFVENGTIMQLLKSDMRTHWGWEKLEPYEKEALEMIQHKIGRILCGNHKFYDHWRDIAGYAKLVEERCPQPEKKQ